MRSLLHTQAAIVMLNRARERPACLAKSAVSAIQTIFA